MKLCLSLHYNGTNSFLFVNSTEIRKCKVKDSEIVATPLKNNSKDWSVGNMKRTGFNGYVYDFSVDYDTIAVDDILDIHRHLMKKNNMIQKCLGLLKIVCCSDVIFCWNYIKCNSFKMCFNE